MTSKMKYTKEEIQKMREVRLQTFLGLPDLGSDIKIRCSFHNERTPSCIIYADKGYRCFACGKKGNNCIDFYVDLGGTFSQACDELYKYI